MSDEPKGCQYDLDETALAVFATLREHGAECAGCAVRVLAACIGTLMSGASAGEQAYVMAETLEVMALNAADLDEPYDGPVGHG